MRRQRLRLLHPGDVEALQRLDVFGIVALHPLEDDDRSVPSADLGPKHVEEPAKSQFLDLVDQQLPNRLLETVLHLTNARRPCRRAVTAGKKHFGKKMRFATTTPSIRPLVAMAFKQQRQLSRHVDGQGRGAFARQSRTCVESGCVVPMPRAGTTALRVT